MSASWSLPRKILPALAVAVLAALAGPALRGQTVLTGTYSGGPGSITGDVVINASTSATFTGGTTFTGTNGTFGNYSTLNWNQTGTLAGKTLTFGSSGGYAYLVVGPSGSLTLDSATTLTGNLYVYNGNNGGTIINQGAITQNVNTGYLYAPTFTNSGSITATAGAGLYLGYYASDVTTNAAGGSITATGTGANVYLTNIVNLGNLYGASNGVLNFQGSTNTTAHLGSVTLSGGGRALISGTLDNTSATLNAPTGGAYELYGGTINNGTVAAGALGFTNNGGTLSNVSYTGDLTLGGSNAVIFTNGTTFTGTNLTLGTYATLTWNQTGTLSGKNITFGSAGSYAYLNVGHNGSLTLGSTTSVTGNLYLYNSNDGGSIINQGSISQTSGTGYIYAPNFTNSGTVTVNAGTSLYVGYFGSDVFTNAAGGSLTATGTGAAAYLSNVTNLGNLYATSNGVLNFQGANNTTANLGSVTLSSGGRALLSGTLDNTSATLNAPSGGAFELAAGTINNGTIAAGALGFTPSGGTLSNVSYTGDLILPSSAVVTFTNGTAFSGTNLTLGNYATLNWNQDGTLAGKAITLGTAGGYAYFNVGHNHSLTLGSATTLAGDIYLYNGNDGGSITNQGSISQTSGSGYIYAPSVTNSGSITVNAGTSLTLGYYSTDLVTNAAGGTLTVTGTGANAYLNNITNLGTLSAQLNGVLYFQGANNTTAHLGTVTLSGGGRALIYGTLDNTSATLNAPTGGVFELNTGIINNGTIAAGALGFTSGGGTLSNVTYTGDFTLPASTSVTFTNGTVFTGTNLTLGNYSTLNWNQNGSLAGKVITSGSAGSYGYFNVGHNRSLILTPTTTLGGSVYLYNSNDGGSITNQGAISQDAGTGYIYAPTFTNSGSITVNPGATLYVGYYNTDVTTNANGATFTVTGTGASSYLTNIINLGTLSAQLGGVLYFQGINNTTANLGTVNLSGGSRALLYGTLDNTSATLNAPTGGVFELYGGTLSNGATAAGALSFTSSGGTLSNVSYGGDLTLPANASVTFVNGTSVTGTNLNLGNYSTLTWNQDSTLAGKNVTFGSGGAYANLNLGTNRTLTVGSTTTMSGSVYLSGNSGSTLINQGTISQTSGTGYLYVPTFTNAGILSAQTGTTYISGALTNTTGGTLTGSGTFYGNVAVTGGTIAPGNTLGTLTFSSGTFAVSGPTTFAVDLSGASSDQLVFQNPTGAVDIGSGQLSLSLNLLAAPTLNTTFDLLHISSGGSGITGTFVGLPSTGDTLVAYYSSTPYTFTVNYLTNDITLVYGVPEPSTWALLGGGLGLLLFRRRRRR